MERRKNLAACDCGSVLPAAAPTLILSPGDPVKANIRPAMLAAVIAIAGLAGFALDAAAPRPLYAQMCGNKAGKLCLADCGKECSNGSCCGWSYYYYPKPEEVQ